MFLSGYCGIVAELCLFTLAESLIGSTLNNLLYTMGVMMFFMGVGSWFMSKSFTRHWDYGGFISLEITLSLAVCTSIPSLTFLCGIFPHLSSTSFIITSALIGFLIGMEIPLMQKLLQNLTGHSIQEIAGKIMMADYFGSLLGFTLFTLLLLYKLGLPWTAFSSGCVNGAIAVLVIIHHFGLRSTKGWGLFFIYLPCMIWIGSSLDATMQRAEQSLYRNPVILQEQTPYQKLTITSPSMGTNPQYELSLNKKMSSQQPLMGNLESDKNLYEWRRLPNQQIAFYINGGLQFHSSDEYLYHENLVHPAILACSSPKRVLLMGAGDGLALREVIKHKTVTDITLVELDPAVVELFKRNPELRQLHKNAFADKRLKLVYQDAWNFARHHEQAFDVIILDFPDPHHIETAKLYSLQFYRLLSELLSTDGILATQSTSPLYSRKSYLCIRKTLEAANFNVLSTHIEMPSFAQWGFHLASASKSTQELQSQILKHLSTQKFDHHLDRSGLELSWSWSQHFWEEYSEIKTNDFYNYILLHYYQKP